MNRTLFVLFNIPHFKLLKVFKKKAHIDKLHKIYKTANLIIENRSFTLNFTVTSIFFPQKTLSRLSTFANTAAIQKVMHQVIRTHTTKYHEHVF